MSRIIFGAEPARVVCERLGVDCWPMFKPDGTPTKTGFAKLDGDGKIVCGVAFESYTGEGGSVTIHNYCGKNHMMTRDWILAVLDFAFNILKVNRLYGCVKSTNAAALAFNDKFGAKRCAVLEGYYGDADRVIFVNEKSACRWLKAASAKKLEALRQRIRNDCEHMANLRKAPLDAPVEAFPLEFREAA